MKISSLTHEYLEGGCLLKWRHVITLALGSQPKQGVARLRAKRLNPVIMPHAPESARKCEGIDPHIPKGTPTLGVGVPVDSRMFTK